MKLIFSLMMALVVSVGAARAQSFAVPNFSFESPGGNNYQFNNGNSSFIPNWYFDDDSGQSGELINPFAASGNPGTSNGATVAAFNVGPNSHGATARTLASVTTITAGTNYTLTVALGNEAGMGNFQQPGTFTLELESAPNGTLTLLDASAPINLDLLTDGTIADYSVTLTAAQASAYVGQGLYIQILASNTETNGNSTQPMFDNVRLAGSVPEPSVNAMIAVGFALLVVAIFNKRRKA